MTKQSCESRRFLLLLLVALAGAGFPSAGQAAQPMCPCLPADMWNLSCEAGDGQCAQLQGQLSQAQRYFEQECLPDQDCRAILDAICPDLCAQIDAANRGLPPPPLSRPLPSPGDSLPRKKDPADPRASKPLPPPGDKPKTDTKPQDPKKAEQCRELIAYRNGELLREWDVQARKSDVFQEAISDVRVLREQLNSDNWWLLSSIPEVALTIKTACDVVSGVMGVVAPGGDVAKLSRKVLAGTRSRHQVAEKVYDRIQKGQKAKMLAAEEFDELVISLSLDELGQVGAALGLIKDSYENLLEFEKIGKGKDAYRRILQEQTTNLDNALRRHQAAATAAVRNLEGINGVKDAIDRYCSEPPTAGPAVKPPG